MSSAEPDHITLPTPTVGLGEPAIYRDQREKVFVVACTSHVKSFLIFCHQRMQNRYIFVSAVAMIRGIILINISRDRQVYMLLYSFKINLLLNGKALKCVRNWGRHNSPQFSTYFIPFLTGAAYEQFSKNWITFLLKTRCQNCANFYYIDWNDNSSETNSSSACLPLIVFFISRRWKSHNQWFSSLLQ